MKRHLFFILFLSILSASGGFYYSFTHQVEQVKSTLFLTVANQNSLDPAQAEGAATFFGETLMGWFRNPVFTSAILGNSGLKNISFSAMKQERQNMLIEISGNNQKDVQKAANNTLLKLKEEVNRYNQSAKSNFVVIDQGKTTRVSQTQSITLPLAAILFGFILAIMLTALKEFWRDQISSTEEAEQILGVKALDFLKKDWEKNDLTLLSVAIQKAHPIVILAGVNISTEILAVALAHKHSFFGEKIALVDGDLKRRTLQETLGLSSRMKNIKGHTDIYSEEGNMSTSIVIQNTLDENLKFLPAGKGQRFLIEVLKNVALEMRTLIHSQLPENSEVLRLTNATLILVVHIGTTKRKHLKRIREVWKEDLRLVIVE